MADGSSPFSRVNTQPKSGMRCRWSRATPGRRQRDLEQSPVIGRREQFDQAGVRCFDRSLARRLPGHSQRASKIRERRRAAAALDRAKQPATGPKIQRRLAVERSCLAETVGRSHDLEQKSRRLDMKFVEQRPIDLAVARR